jgi:fructose-1-phosphate kinase PfkB-like protein
VVEHTEHPQRLPQPCASPAIATADVPRSLSRRRLIDPSGAVAEAEVDGLLGKIEEQLVGGGTIGAVAFCGTTPPGAAGLYAAHCRQLSKIAEAEDVLLLLDGHKQVEEVLASGRVDILKLNVDEVQALTSTSTPEEAAHAVLRAPNSLLTRPGALLALTDGSAPARLFAANGASWTLEVPQIDCVNAIGAGDVCTAIFLAELVAARSKVSASAGAANGDEELAAAVEAFAWGLAAACARCTHNLPTEFERSEAAAMKEKIKVAQAHW